MELPADDCEALKIISERVKAILSQSPQETPHTQVLGRGARVARKGQSFINLHNQRLYYQYSKIHGPVVTNNLYIKPNVKNQKAWVGTTVKEINHGKEIFIKNFLGCNFRIKRETIQVNNVEGSNRWYLFNHGETQEYDVILQNIKNEIKEKLQALIEIIGGESDYKLLNFHCEAKIRNDELMEKLPSKMRFYNGMVKKVYEEKNIEFLDPSFASNYLSNMGIREIAPNLSEILDRFAWGMQVLNPYRAILLQIKEPGDVLKYPELVAAMTKKERAALSNELIRRFSI